VATKQAVSLSSLGIGLGLALIGCVIGFDAMTMRVPPTYAKVGPHIFPIIVAAGLIVTGLIIAFRSIARTGEPLAAESAETDWGAVAIVSVGLILNALLLKPLGFIIAALGLFMAVSLAFGSRRYLRDLVIGIVLALVTYFGFTRGLGLQLPAGLFAGIF